MTTGPVWLTDEQRAAIASYLGGNPIADDRESIAGYWCMAHVPGAGFRYVACSRDGHISRDSCTRPDHVDAVAQGGLVSYAEFHPVRRAREPGAVRAPQLSLFGDPA